MNLDLLKKYAHDLHQIAGKHQADEYTSSLAWWEYRCKLVEFLFDCRKLLVERDLVETLTELGYYPAKYWYTKFGICRYGFYRDVAPKSVCHAVKLNGKKTYYTFQIGYTHTRAKMGRKLKPAVEKKPVGRPKKLRFNPHQY